MSMTTVRGGGPVGVDVPTDPPRSARPRPRVRQVLQGAVLGAPVLVVIVLGWTHRWMTEDGFIYLRIARQLRDGHGPVFTQGERVEAFTGTLWVGVIALADLVAPFRMEWIAIVLGLAATASGVALAMAGARRLAPRVDRDAFWVPLGSLVFVAVFPVWAYATSGLETGLVFAWLGGCLWTLARWADRPGSTLSVPAAVLIGLGWLVRPEMAVFSAAFVVVVALGQRAAGRRAMVRLVVAAVALPVAYQVFRMAYFGILVPNTAIAKEGTDGQWGRGWRYFLDFAEPYFLWVAALGLVLGGYLPLVARMGGGSRRRLAVTGAFVAGAVVNTTYVIAVGGDYHHGRMFLPALFAITAPIAAVPATRSHAAGLVVAAWAVVAGLALRPEQHGDNWFANGFLAPQEFGKVTTDDYGWGEGDPSLGWVPDEGFVHEAGIGQYVHPEVALRPDLDQPYAALWAIGIAGYAPGNDLAVLDMMGLAHPLASHMEATPSLDPLQPRYPGHEKPLPAPWVAALVTPPGTFPPETDFPSFGNPLIPPTEGQEFREQVAWARSALGCDAIADLLRSSQGDLSLRRAGSNLVRSFEHTRMRIPPDPEEAYRRYCGDGTPAEVRAARGA